jgi:hypothetical protein
MAVHGDLHAGGDALPEARGPAVDCHAPFLDEPVRLAAGAMAAVGYVFVQTPVFQKITPDNYIIRPANRQAVENVV